MSAVRSRQRAPIHPSARRQADKAALGNTFEVVAREWLDLVKDSIKESTFERERSQLERFVFTELGDQPVSHLTTPEILGVLKKIEVRGISDTAHRVRSACLRVLRYAARAGRPHNVNSDDLRGALAPVVKQHYPAIVEPLRAGELLRAIDDYVGQPTTVAALKLAPYLFVRPGELRMMEHSELNLDAAEWRIPGGRMKMGEPHIVPLSSQAVAILRNVQLLGVNSRYVFPSLLSRDRPMSENTVNNALRRLGYSNQEMTGHGFRSMASTLLNEQGWHPDLIELQLAHAERNKVRAAYNRAQRLDERRKMMQSWSDYLDGLRAGANVVPIKHRA